MRPGLRSMFAFPGTLSRCIGSIRVCVGLSSSFVDNFQTKCKVDPSSESPSVSASVETVFVFDWDDTLLCTSSIVRNSWDATDLSELQAAVEALLSSALNLGEVLIVTNGIETWVAESAKTFFPGLQPLLQKVDIISARSLYENRFPSNTFAWKLHTFLDIFAPRKDSCPQGMNIIVVGDSLDEIAAAIHTSQVLGPSSLVKTLKFVEKPGLDALVGQVRRVTRDLRTIALDARSLNQKMLRHSDKKLAADKAWDIGTNKSPFLARYSHNRQPKLD